MVKLTNKRGIFVGGTVTVFAYLHPVFGKRECFKIRAGLKVSTMLRVIEAPQAVYVEINGVPVREEERGKRRLKKGDLVGVRACPKIGGSSNPVSGGIMAASPINSMGGPAGMGGGKSGIGLQLLTGLLGRLFTSGTAATNTLAPNAPLGATPAQGTKSGAKDVLVGAITGIQNQVSQWGAYPVCYGLVNNVYPPLATNFIAYSNSSGVDQEIDVVFACGPGPLSIGNAAIGGVTFNTTNFPGVGYDVQDGSSTLTTFTQYYWWDSQELVLDAALTYDNKITNVAPQEAYGANGINVGISFPDGLYTVPFSSGGAAYVSFDIHANDGDSLEGPWGGEFLLGSITVGANAVRAYYAQAQYDVGVAYYEISVTRTTANSTGTTVDASMWISLIAGITGNPPVIPQTDQYGAEIKMGYVDISVPDSSQANGMLSQFSVDLGRYLPMPEVTYWSSPILTDNPSAAFADVICGQMNARFAGTGILHLASLSTWSDFCYVNGLGYNVVINDQKTAEDRLKDICAAGRASLQVYDGLIGVFIEDAQDVVTQHFTPRNSSGFTLKRTFLSAGMPQGIICHFLDPLLNNQQNEYRVYAAGYDASSATIFQTVEFPGVNNTAQLDFLAGYQLKVMRERTTSYEFTVESEGLICQKGDLVWAASDVALWGDQWGRIIAVQYDGSGNAISCDVDEPYVMDGTSYYTTRIRNKDNFDISAHIVTETGPTTHLTFDPAVPAGYALPYAGDLVIYGYTPGVQLIITGIEPQNDFTHKITAQDYAGDAIY